MFKSPFFKLVVLSVTICSLFSSLGYTKAADKKSKAEQKKLEAEVEVEPVAPAAKAPPEVPAEPVSDMYVEEPEPPEEIPPEEKLDKKAKRLKEAEERKAKKLAELADIPQVLGKYYFVGIGMHGASTVDFSDSSFTTMGSSIGGSTKFRTQPAFELSFGVINSKVESMGGFFNLTYQTERKIKSVIQKTGSVETKSVFPGGQPTVQINLIEFGALYRWKHGYFPIGFNYSLPQYHGVVESGLKTKVKGGIGVQLGYGEFINKKWFLEGLYKSISVESSTSAGATELDYGAGTAASWSFQARYVF